MSNLAYDQTTNAFADACILELFNYNNRLATQLFKRWLHDYQLSWTTTQLLDRLLVENWRAVEGMAVEKDSEWFKCSFCTIHCVNFNGTWVLNAIQ